MKQQKIITAAFMALIFGAIFACYGTIDQPSTIYIPPAAHGEVI